MDNFSGGTIIEQVNHEIVIMRFKTSNNIFHLLNQKEADI